MTSISTRLLGDSLYTHPEHVKDDFPIESDPRRNVIAKVYGDDPGKDLAVVADPRSDEVATLSMQELIAPTDHAPDKAGAGVLLGFILGGAAGVVPGIAVQQVLPEKLAFPLGIGITLASPFVGAVVGWHLGSNRDKAQRAEAAIPPEQRPSTAGRNTAGIDAASAEAAFERWPMLEPFARGVVGIDRSRTPAAVADAIIAAADADGDGQLAYTGASKETAAGGDDFTRLLRQADVAHRDGHASSEEIAKVVAPYAEVASERLSFVPINDHMSVGAVYEGMLNDQEARRFVTDWIDVR